MNTHITWVGVVAWSTCAVLGCDNRKNQALPMTTAATVDLDTLTLPTLDSTNHVIRTVEPPQHQHFKIRTVEADPDIDDKIRVMGPTHNAGKVVPPAPPSAAGEDAGDDQAIER